MTSDSSVDGDVRIDPLLEQRVYRGVFAFDPLETKKNQGHA